MALYTNSGVSGDASVLALAKGALADFAIPHSAEAGRQVFAKCGMGPSGHQLSCSRRYAPDQRIEIHFSHVRPLIA